jgi:UDP-N-acetylmuramate dehydrogenase
MRLADYTTLRLGGPARGFVRAATEDELIETVRAADAGGQPVLILGGGSNLVVADEGFDGTVIQVATRGVSRGDEPGVLTVAAGEDWDAVVARTVAEGLAGLECLSGIPGLAGATPIQNVGAYGQEVAETITRVRVYDRLAGHVQEIPNDQCGFGYRTSRFRGDARFVVLSVTFGLAVQARSVPVRYAELAAFLGVAPGDQVESTEARAAVIELRQRKGMVIDPADPDTRSVGSFFVNPVLDAAALARVEAAARARSGPDTRVPRFAAEGSGDGLVKVPAAWLIEQAGFGKGYNPGDGARISAKHTLALVNAGSASTAALLALAREIRDGVRGAFGVSLAPEPVLVGVTLLPGIPADTGHPGGRGRVPSWPPRHGVTALLRYGARPSGSGRHQAERHRDGRVSHRVRLAARLGRGTHGQVDGERLGRHEPGVRAQRVGDRAVGAEGQPDPVGHGQAGVAARLLHDPDHVAGGAFGRQVGRHLQVQCDQPGLPGQRRGRVAVRRG